MGKEQGEAGREEVREEVHVAAPLVRAVEVADVSRVEWTFWDAWSRCDTLSRTGCVLAWLITSQSDRSGPLNS